MKRIEMVKLISDNVISSMLPNLSLNRKNLLADMMLTEAEKNGMMPPGCEEDIITATSLNGSPIGYSYAEYKWETEDEKK